MKRLEYQPGIVAGTERHDKITGQLVNFDYVDGDGYYHKNFNPKMLRIVEALTGEWVDIDTFSDIQDSRYFRHIRAAARKLRDIGLLEIKMREDGHEERACMLDSFFVRVPQEAQTDDDRRLVSVMAALSAIAFDHELADLLIEFTAWYGKRQGRPNWIGAAGEHVVCARCSTSFSRHWTNQKYCNEKCATEAQKARERSMRVAFKAMKELNLIQIGD